jgi:hypothetical protein
MQCIDSPAGVKSSGNKEKIPEILAITKVLKCAWLSAASKLRLDISNEHSNYREAYLRGTSTSNIAFS